MSFTILEHDGIVVYIEDGARRVTITAEWQEHWTPPVIEGATIVNNFPYEVTWEMTGEPVTLEHLIRVLALVEETYRANRQRDIDHVRSLADYLAHKNYAEEE